MIAVLEGSAGGQQIADRLVRGHWILRQIGERALPSSHRTCKCTMKRIHKVCRAPPGASIYRYHRYSNRCLQLGYTYGLMGSRKQVHHCESYHHWLVLARDKGSEP